jgi:hypothetical protein
MTSTDKEFFHNEESDDKIVINDESNRILSSDELTAQRNTVLYCEL